MKKDKIIDAINFVDLCIMVILITIFHQKLKITFLVLGIGSLVSGCCLVLKKEKNGWAFASFGLSLVIDSILYYYEILDKVDAITFMICCTAFLLSVLTIMISILNMKNIHKQYAMRVVSKVIDLQKNESVRKECYRIIYSYDVDEKTFNIASLGYVDKNIPNIGDSKELLVDPNDYANVYFDKSKWQKILEFGVETLLALASLIILITLF